MRWLVPLLLLLGVQAAAAAPPAPLDRPQLDKRISAGFAAVPLPAVLKQLQAETGVALRAAAPLDERPVTLHLRDLPARRALEMLARLLGGEWRDQAGALRLIQTSEGRSELEEARRQDQDAALKLLRSRIGELAVLARLKNPELHLALREGERAGASVPPAPAAAGEAASARYLLQPGGRELVELLSTLDEAAWSELATAGRMLLGTARRAGARLIAPPLASRLREAIRFRDPVQPPPAAAEDLPVPAAPPVVSARREALLKLVPEVLVSLDLRFSVRQAAPELRLIMRAEPVPVDGIAPAAPDPLLLTSQPPPPPLTPQISAEVPAGLRKWRVPGAAGGDWLNPLLEVISREYGISIAADGYRRPLLSRAPLSGEQEMVLSTALNRLVRPAAAMEWQDGALLVKLQGRCWMQPGYVPPSLVEIWKPRLRGNGPLSLDLAGRLAQEVSAEQAPEFSALLRRSGIRLTGLEQLLEEPGVVQFWQALAPQQKAELQAGRPVQSTAVPAGALRALEAMLKRRSLETGGGLYIPRGAAQISLVRPGPQASRPAAVRPVPRPGSPPSLRLQLRWTDGTSMIWQARLPLVRPAA